MVWATRDDRVGIRYLTQVHFRLTILASRANNRDAACGPLNSALAAYSASDPQGAAGAAIGRTVFVTMIVLQHRGEARLQLLFDPR